ncbi:hypothetical protein [Nostoc sp. NMS7]|uniref:hypothetical protein n=1 Tax=Nostoc sp. NMS7 TaxID=2815391 RepID=UPI0025ED046B|nr:hypothetical protein [Nostoc sp. NMS7]
MKCVATGKEEDNQQAGDRKEEAQRLCGESEFPPSACFNGFLSLARVHIWESRNLLVG